MWPASRTSTPFASTISAVPEHVRSVRSTTSVVITCPHDVIDTVEDVAAATVGTPIATMATTTNTISLRIHQPPSRPNPHTSSPTNLKTT